MTWLDWVIVGFTVVMLVGLWLSCRWSRSMSREVDKIIREQTDD